MFSDATKSIVCVQERGRTEMLTVHYHFLDFLLLLASGVQRPQTGNNSSDFACAAVTVRQQ